MAFPEKSTSCASHINGDRDYLFQSLAQIMVRKDIGWEPMGVGGLSRIVVIQQRQHSLTKLDYLIEAYRLSGGEDINASVTSSSAALVWSLDSNTRYYRINPTFHSWTTKNERIGLTFDTFDAAEEFGRVFQTVLHEILEQTHSRHEKAEQSSSETGEDNRFLNSTSPLSNSTGINSASERCSSGLVRGIALRQRSEELRGDCERSRVSASCVTSWGSCQHIENNLPQQNQQTQPHPHPHHHHHHHYYHHLQQHQQQQQQQRQHIHIPPSMKCFQSPEEAEISFIGDGSPDFPSQSPLPVTQTYSGGHQRQSQGCRHTRSPSASSAPCLLRLNSSNGCLESVIEAYCNNNNPTSVVVTGAPAAVGLECDCRGLPVSSGSGAGGSGGGGYGDSGHHQYKNIGDKKRTNKAVRLFCCCCCWCSQSQFTENDMDQNKSAGSALLQQSSSISGLDQSSGAGGETSSQYHQHHQSESHQGIIMLVPPPRMSRHSPDILTCVHCRRKFRPNHNSPGSCELAPPDGARLIVDAFTLWPRLSRLYRRLCPPSPPLPPLITASSSQFGTSPPISGKKHHKLSVSSSNEHIPLPCTLSSCYCCCRLMKRSSTTTTTTTTNIAPAVTGSTNNTNRRVSMTAIRRCLISSLLHCLLPCLCCRRPCLACYEAGVDRGVLGGRHSVVVTLSRKSPHGPHSVLVFGGPSGAGTVTTSSSNAMFGLASNRHSRIHQRRI